MNKIQEVKTVIKAKMVGGWVGSRNDTGAPKELKMLLPMTWVVIANGSLYDHSLPLRIFFEG